ncbi:hypothetical protein C8R42DRAFT_644695 [Lentinula raphanica]|nr:hypothetical protein C8R42DRAFT_644695 [Lentinula raphanica]
MPNQHLPLHKLTLAAPDDEIREPLEFWFNCRRTDKQLAEILKDYYDTTKYGLGETSVKRLRRKFGLQGTRQQAHTIESIQEMVLEAREKFPARGAQSLREYLFDTQRVRIPR